MASPFFVQWFAGDVGPLMTAYIGGLASPLFPGSLLLGLNLYVAFFGHFDEVLNLVSVLLGHFLDALILVVGVAVLDLDLARLGLAINHFAGNGDDQRSFLMACGKAIVGADARGHDAFKAGDIASATTRKPGGRPYSYSAACATRKTGSETTRGAGETDVWNVYPDAAAGERRATESVARLWSGGLGQVQPFDRFFFALA